MVFIYSNDVVGPCLPLCPPPFFAVCRYWLSDRSGSGLVGVRGITASGRARFDSPIGLDSKLPTDYSRNEKIKKVGLKLRKG